MQNRLPLFIDPIKSAQQRLDYEGIYLKDKFTRLNDSVSQLNSDILCHLSFYYDERKIVVMKIKAELSLDLTCQRCFKDFTTTIDIENLISPVKNDSQVLALPEYYDPAIINEFGELDLISIIEDEIILALPLSPLHDSQDCEISEQNFVFGDLPEEDEKPNPFAVLTQFKIKDKE